MQKIKVKKSNLIEKIKENKEKHKALVEKAKNGYIETMKKELNKLLRTVKQNKIIDLRHLYTFDQPIDKTPEYDTVLQMLEMSVDEEIEISHQEFLNFVEDKWDWTHQMLISNTKYL